MLSAHILSCHLIRSCILIFCLDDLGQLRNLDHVWSKLGSTSKLKENFLAALILFALKSKEFLQVMKQYIQICKTCHFRLGDVLANQNASKERRQEAMIKEPFSRYPNKRMHLEDKENIPVTRIRESASDNTDTDINESIQSLIEKVNSGLGVSDITNMEFYCRP